MTISWQDRAGATFATEKRSAIGSQGMVVTNNPLGSSAGAEMLAAGGNAIDAAIASLFALTVVEPMMVGIFGAGMSTIRLADGSHHFINNYSVAPQAATDIMFETLSDTWPDYQEVKDRKNDIGVLATGVPGTLKGWTETLEQWGTFPLDQVMAPAIRYAQHGFLTTHYLSEIIQLFAKDIARFNSTVATWMPNGQPLQPGERVIQTDYANLLKTIAAQGPDVLYGGALGKTAVDYIQSQGGIMTLDDLKNYKTMPADVVKGTYRGYDIIGPPPPTAGGVHVIEMLNILEAYDVSGLGFGTSEGVHLIAEVLKTGFEDRREYMGDPAFVDVPVEMLISKEYADERRALIKLDSARDVNTTYSAESHDTTHLATADALGNIVCATHTIHAAFGSKATVPGTGMLLNNTMNIFDPHPGTANSIAPGKRVTSSMSPIIVEKDGKPVFCVGLVGGIKIFPSALQAIVNIIDHGMTPQEAVEAPRVWTLGEDLEMEPGFSEATIEGLKTLGHRITPLFIIGAGMGMIAFNNGELTGASCWRADGTPIAIAGGMARKGLRFTV
ncbi:MAG: gamma-glutamyltranspeptidase/glutathione hydrolase [Candidatus Azotimanducaceae bacterium]|jgi:gamma-glutamyltranspeptidase/glutathione hydrolase